MSQFMGGGCCCSTCAIATDSMAALTNWTQVAGTWTSPGTFAETSSANALLIFNTVHPDGIASCVVTVTAKCSFNAGTIGVIVGYTDSSNYFFAQLVQGTQNGSIELWQVASGTPTRLAAVPFLFATATLKTITVYFDGATTGNFSATVDTTTVQAFVAGGGTYTGTSVGVGTGSTSFTTYDFENFTFAKYLQSGTATTCASVTPGCGLNSDNFTRGNGSGLSTAWTKVSGTSSISSNQLSLAANTIVQWMTPTPITGAMINNATFKSTTSGCAVRLIVGLTNSSNYFFAEFIIGTGTVQLFKVVSGTASPMSGLSSIALPTSTSIAAFACLSGGVFTAGLAGSDPGEAVAVTTPTFPCYTALACGSTGTALFSAFAMSKGHDATNDPNCATCTGAAPGNCAGCAVPNTLPATCKLIVPSGTFSGGSCGAESQYEGTYFFAMGVTEVGTPGCSGDACVSNLQGYSCNDFVAFTVSIGSGGFYSNLMSESGAFDYNSGAVTAPNSAHYYLFFSSSCPHTDLDPTGNTVCGTNDPSGGNSVIYGIFDLGTSAPDCTSLGTSNIPIRNATFSDNAAKVGTSKTVQVTFF